MKTVYLVRHGQTVGNLENFSQTPDTPLTEAGHEGAKAVASRFTHLNIEKLVASPYKRAQETAGYISEVKNLPIVTFDSWHENLRPEAIRGKTYNEDTKDTFEGYYNNFWSDVSEFEGAESFADVLVRIKNCLQFLDSEESETIAVVSHGDFLRMFVAHLLAEQSDEIALHEKVAESMVRLNNVAMTVIVKHEDKWQLKIYNDHAHFAE